MKSKLTENELTILIKKLNLDELDVDSAVEYGLKEENADGRPIEQDGRIQIRDQKIIVHDPLHGGKPPILSFSAPVKLKINGVQADSEAIVTSKDHIEWEIDDGALYDIAVSEDKLKATFRLISKERYAWRLMDTESALKVTIAAEQTKDIVLESLHLAHVVSDLERKSIKSNLDVASIQQELINPTYKPIVIAKGKAATPGIDAQLNVYFSEQVESKFFEVSGIIDFRNHLQIPSVKKGDIIAKKIPPVSGIPGYDVYGKVIVPTPPKDIFVVAKSNVEMASGGEIIALKEGRPRITGGKIKTFDISTAYLVPGDVDIETGNIVFSGDVIVYGNVTDNMIVESLGNVYVYGSVYNATVTATGSIHIRGNVIGSKLYSGYFGVMFNRLYHASKTLSEHIEKLILASNMLLRALETKKQSVRYGQIVLLLMENKMKEIPAIIKELLVVISNIQHIKKEEYKKLVDMSGLFLQPTKLLDAVTMSYMKSYLALLQETHQEVARMQEEKVEIRINQCHNSEVKSNGHVRILRDGVILSDLYSSGDIIFEHELSVCRGARLESGGSISAKIIGGQTGANTILKAKKKVDAKKIYSGRICVGKYCTDIYDSVDNVRFDSNNMKHHVSLNALKQKLADEGIITGKW
jgi:uncharacterized protein